MIYLLTLNTRYMKFYNTIMKKSNEATPKWAGNVRSIALLLSMSAGALVVSPIALPATIITIAQVLTIVAPAVATWAQSQSTEK